VKSILTNAIGIEDPKNPDECNVYNILKLFLTNEEDNNIRKQYQSGGLSYKDVKMYLYEKIITFVKPIQSKLNDITDQEVDKILKE
jgi:tryptophanyl-tRNA synthetase